jgi:hypothetical protein
MHRVISLAALLLTIVFLAAPGRADAPTILVDGTVARTDAPALTVDGHVLVPLRGVFERFGATVDYDAKTNTAIAQRAGTIVKIAVDSTDAWVNGHHVTLETPAREFGGRVEVPLRFVAEALGVSVDFDSLTNTVVIVSGFKQGNFVAAGPGTPAAQNAPSNAYAPQLPSIAPSVDEKRPTPNSLVGSQYPQIYARFSGGGSVDPTSVRLLVDGADVTDSATVSSAYVAYTPASPLDGGSHEVEISGQSADGAPFDERWSFRVDTGMTSNYVSSVVGYSAPAFGYPRFGFFPPGFSVFAPGPQFFVEDEPIVIVFFSPFFNGNGFFTVSGMPGEFEMTPWLGCPGFFWSAFTVPSGVVDPEAIVAAHFSTSDGRVVLVHSTAPLRIDGSRKSLPSDIRFAVKAKLVNRPATPRLLVAFHRTLPIAHITPIGRKSASGRTILPIARRTPFREVSPRYISRRLPVAMRRLPEPVPFVRAVPPPPPIVIPVRPPVPIVPAPQPIPIRPMPAPAPVPVPVPLKPIPPA